MGTLHKLPHRIPPFTVIEQPIPDYPQRFVSDNIGRVVPDQEWANAFGTALSCSAPSRVSPSRPKASIAFAACCDALADFICDVAENPSLAFVCAFGGVLTGMFATIGLAYVWSLFL